MTGDIFHIQSFRTASDRPEPTADELACVMAMSGTFTDRTTETPVTAVNIADSPGLFPFGDPAALFKLSQGDVVIEYQDGTTAQLPAERAFDRLLAADAQAAESIDLYFSNLQDTTAVDALIEANNEALEEDAIADASRPQRKSGAVSLAPRPQGG